MEPNRVDPPASREPDDEASGWSLRTRGFDGDRVGVQESLFSLSNGYVGWRGNLDEGDPVVVAGSYLNGVHERHPMPYAEPGYGYPSYGQAVVNVTDGKILRLFVDDAPMDIRTGRLDEHEQVLDFRSGVLRREMRWTSPAGRTVDVVSERLVSLRHPAIAVIRYTVRAVDAPVTVRVQSELVPHQPLPSVHPDPRVEEALDAAFVADSHHLHGTTATLLHRTRHSGISVAVCMDHEVHGPGGKAEVQTEVSPDLARTSVRAVLQPGEELTVTKYVSHQWAGDVSAPTLRDRAEEAVREARRGKWNALARQQREALDDFWDRADVVIEGDPALQQAIRFALFHLFQSTACLTDRSVPSKGLTGTGYSGHTFWDCETFVLPPLMFLVPDAARTALQWRHDTLPEARERAVELSLAGATFPWRTIDGRESSGYWPAGTAAFHNNAAIAAAASRYVRVSGDEDFERRAGTEILIQTARLWMELGRWGHDDRFHIDGVTGPDEYSALADDNVYTNLSARENLEAAAEATRRHRTVADGLEVSIEEITSWERAARAMAVPYDETLGVHPQSARFTDHAAWDFDAMSPDQYPLQEHFPYVELYRKQVVKQADLVLALYTSGDAFSAEEKARNFDYYEALTVRDSSLSAPVQAIIAAEVGHLDLAMAYLRETSSLDTDDTQGDTEDGLHLASLAGTWSALVAGFGGMRETSRGLRFAPRLPQPLDRLSFRLTYRGALLEVDISRQAARYTLVSGERCAFGHHGEQLELDPGQSIERTIPPLDSRPVPRQPAHRSPANDR